MFRRPHSESLGQWLASLNILGRADARTILAADVLALIQGLLLAVAILSPSWSGPVSITSFVAFLVQIHWALKIFATRSDLAYPPVGHAAGLTEPETLALLGSLRAYRGFLAASVLSPATVVIAGLRDV